MSDLHDAQPSKACHLSVLTLRVRNHHAERDGYVADGPRYITSATADGLSTNTRQLAYLGLLSLRLKRGLRLGLTGGRMSFIRASCGVRPPFLMLQVTQQET